MLAGKTYIRGDMFKSLLCLYFEGKWREILIIRLISRGRF